MRWVFIRPQNHSPYYDPEIQEPLGLEYLAASRRAKGDAVLLLDSVLNGSVDKRLARRSASFQPEAIGFSLTTAQEVDSVKNIYKEGNLALAGRPVHWLAGGNFISTEADLARRLLPESFILVRFEGENILQDFAVHWSTKKLEAIKGIHSGRSVQCLDRLSFPERPFADEILSNEWAFNLQGSRGCCGACKYCASAGMAAETGNQWRGRSANNIVEEMVRLYEQFGACAFNFVDEDFLGPKHLAELRASEFATALRDSGLRCCFSIQIRPASTTKRIINTLRKVGLAYVFMGIESDNPEDFKRWGRAWTPQQWELTRHIQHCGIEMEAGALLFHSHSTFEGVRRFAQRLREHGLLNFRTTMNRLDAMPGSLYYVQGLREGILDPDKPGPQPLPFMNHEIERLQADVVKALGPLGPTSMHALCSLPPLVTRRNMLVGSDTDRLYNVLKAILSKMNNNVANTFSEVLKTHKRGIENSKIVKELRRHNLEVAVAEAHELVSEGFALSFEELREAIKIDSGM